MKVTDEMVDRVVADDIAEPNGYHGCPLCGYTGLWNIEFRNLEQRREAVRDLLEIALSDSA